MGPVSSQAAMVGRVLSMDEPQTQGVLKGSLRTVIWVQLLHGHHRPLDRAGSRASLADQDIVHPEAWSAAKHYTRSLGSI